MQEIITSYLVQKKECGLPLLGSFVIKSRPAITDIANKQILSSSSEITFSETADYLADDLISYCSRMKQISVMQAEQELQQWCLQEKLLLDEGKKIQFTSIGYLHKDNGKIIFTKENNAINFLEPVPALRVIHKNDQHSILVGDRDTNSAAMNQFYNEQPLSRKKYSWKVAALILFIVSLLMLAFYFYDHSFTENSIGNQQPVPVVNAAPTHNDLK